MTLPKENRALGIRRMKEMNISLLAKVGWRCLIKKDKL